MQCDSYFCVSLPPLPSWLFAPGRGMGVKSCLSRLEQDLLCGFARLALAVFVPDNALGWKFWCLSEIRF